MLFSEKCIPSDHLKKIFTLTNLNFAENSSLEDIIKITQKEWLRPAGKERWQLEEKTYEKSDELANFFEKIGFFEELKPQKNDYDYLLFMGATVSRMKLRFKHLVALWECGLRFKELVILSGARPLDKNYNEYQELEKYGEVSKNVTTEFESACLIIESEMPKEMRDAVRIVEVNVPMKEGKRPTTDDTIISWLEKKPKSGSCLFVSNQPYGMRQGLVLKTLLPQEFPVDCASSALDSQERDLQLILDELGRCIYQYHKYLEVWNKN